MTRAPRPSEALHRDRYLSKCYKNIVKEGVGTYSDSSRGMRKASVLPEPADEVRVECGVFKRVSVPVFALPITSLPASAWGMVARCTSVIVTKFAFFRALWVLNDNGSSAKRRAAAYPAVSTVASDLSNASGLLPGAGACCVMRS